MTTGEAAETLGSPRRLRGFLPTLAGPASFVSFPYLVQRVESFLRRQQGRLCLGQVRFASLLFLCDILEGSHEGKFSAGGGGDRGRLCARVRECACYVAPWARGSTAGSEEGGLPPGPCMNCAHACPPWRQHCCAPWPPSACQVTGHLLEPTCLLPVPSSLPLSSQATRSHTGAMGSGSWKGDVVPWASASRTGGKPWGHMGPAPQAPRSYCLLVPLCDLSGMGHSGGRARPPLRAKTPARIPARTHSSQEEPL